MFPEVVYTASENDVPPTAERGTKQGCEGLPRAASADGNKAYLVFDVEKLHEAAADAAAADVGVTVKVDPLQSAACQHY